MQQSNNTTDNCLNERSHAVFSSWLVVYLLIFPVFISVIFLGFKKWQTRRPHVTHSDVFTFHMVAMELLNLAGSCVYFACFMTQFNRGLVFGLSLKHFSSVGEMSFHCLTCVERYLAVVQPITYMRLKKSSGVTLRNASIGCVWLFSVTSLILAMTADESREITDPLIFGFVVAVLSISLVSFCSVSVLYVLIRPGPGEGGGDRKRTDQSKRAAAYTILVILGALLLRMVAVGFYYIASVGSDLEICVVVLCTYWLAMPSSLVLPLLFLHREGAMAARRNSLKSKQTQTN